MIGGGASSGRRSRARSSSRRSTGISRVGDAQIGLGVDDHAPGGRRIWARSSMSPCTTHSGRQRTEPFRVVSQISFPVARRIREPGHRRPDHDRRPRTRRLPAGPQQAACRQAAGDQPAPAGSWSASSPVRGDRQRSTTISTTYRSITARAHRPDVTGQLRRSGQLPTHLRGDVGRVRRGDAGPPARGERVAPPTRDRAPEGARVRQRPGRLDGGLASHDVGPRRHRRRRPAGGGDRPRRYGMPSPTTSGSSRSPSCRCCSSRRSRQACCIGANLIAIAHEWAA